MTDPHATVSLDIVLPVTPAGDKGDTVTLTATTSTNESCTGTSAAFPVLAGTNPAVTMTLTCGGGSQSGQTGNIGVTATLVEGDNCPSITSAVVGPDETSVGSSATVAATAVDPDASETVSYAWAPAANFAAPTSAATAYTCTVSGTQTFTLTVSDNHMPTPCTTTATLTIKCDGAVCGDGIVEAGEQCDPPNVGNCGPNCQFLTGTGGTTGAAGAPATGGTGGTGGAAGAPATGGTTGAGGTAATGGTTGTGGVMASCGPNGEDCAACESCEIAATNNGVCFNTSPPTAAGSSPSTFGCDGFTNANDKANCLALLTCLRSTTCQNLIHSATSDYGEAGVGFDDGTPCLCNSTTATTTKSVCLGASAWTGVCAPQFVAASVNSTGTETPVMALFDTTFPVGVAMNLMTCDIDSSQPGSGTASCAAASTCIVPQ
ncbi:MAG TPA: hypothetical protein VHO06_17990 [Polyangia bacterium]|nr:hypothetical protein [Polyangia bacterium]